VKSLVETLDLSFFLWLNLGATLTEDQDNSYGSRKSVTGVHHENGLFHKCSDLAVGFINLLWADHCDSVGWDVRGAGGSMREWNCRRRL
jgi:hypothetical protein